MTDSAGRRNAIIWTVAFTNFATPFMVSGVGVTLPSMGRELAMSGGALGLYETLYLGTAAALMLPAGRLADAGDKNTIYTVGIALFGITTLVLAFLPSVTSYLVVRTMQGAAAAFIAATNMAILTENVPRKRLGRAIGLSIGAVYTGLAAGPFVAGLVTTGLGWRWVYVLSATVTIGAALLSWRSLSHTRRRPQLIFDWPGASMSGVGIMCLVLGSSLAARSNSGWVLAGLGVVMLIAFVIVEKRAASPLMPISVITDNAVLLRALTVQLLTYAGAMGTSFLFSIYLQEMRGWTASEAGRLIVVSPVLMALLAPVGGRLSDRVRPQLVALVGVVLIAVGTLAAFRVPGSGSLVPLVISLVCHGVGFAMFSSPNMAVIMSTAPREHTSMASALASQMRSLGMVCAMMLITFFLARHVGGEGLGEGSRAGLLTAMQLSLGSISVLAVAALIISLRDVTDGLADEPRS